jgi:hypothetical protein
LASIAGGVCDADFVLAAWGGAAGRGGGGAGLGGGGGGGASVIIRFATDLRLDTNDMSHTFLAAREHLIKWNRSGTPRQIVLTYDKVVLPQ